MRLLYNMIMFPISQVSTQCEALSRYKDKCTISLFSDPEHSSVDVVAAACIKPVTLSLQRDNVINTLTLLIFTFCRHNPSSATLTQNQMMGSMLRKIIILTLNIQFNNFWHTDINCSNLPDSTLTDVCLFSKMRSSRLYRKTKLLQKTTSSGWGYFQPSHLKMLCH